MLLDKCINVVDGLNKHMQLY